MQILHTTKLDSQVYQDALAIRKAVFVQEQYVSLADEIDQNEAQACHFVGYLAQHPIATARLLPINPTTYHIQRVAIIRAQRGNHFGRQLFQALENYARRQKHFHLTLNAQDQAIGFYQHLGFHVTQRPGFMDAGIPHHEMQKQLV